MVTDTQATETLESLPKMLPGTVCVQWQKCGRKNCRCTRGELHGPYFFRFWREDGKLRKAYVKRSELETVRKQCAARQQQRLQLRQGLNDWRNLRDLVREHEPDGRSSDRDNR